VAPAVTAAPGVALAGTLGHVSTTVNGKTGPSHEAASLFTGSDVDTAAVTTWVGNIASSVYVKATDASYKVNGKKRRLDFKKAVYGVSMSSSQRNAAVDKICAALHGSPDGSGNFGPVALSADTNKPKVTSFGTVVLVSLKQRKIYVYSSTASYMKVVKTFRCAIGQPKYPTPTGSFYIGKKVKNPTWNNPGSDWAKNMPASIGPGPNNPLGMRAMYLYTMSGSDTGVRFHGVPHSEDSSIGHAASHGCMRMHEKDAENLFKRLSVGTRVYLIK